MLSFAFTYSELLTCGYDSAHHRVQCPHHPAAWQTDVLLQHIDMFGHTRQISLHRTLIWIVPHPQYTEACLLPASAMIPPLVFVMQKTENRVTPCL